jgi:hypothetical protein
MTEKTAGLALIKRFWPGRVPAGDAAYVLASLFASSGLPHRLNAQLVTCINSGANYRTHLRLAKEAVFRAPEVQQVYWSSLLCDIFGNDIGTQALGWLGFAPSKPPL